MTYNYTLAYPNNTTNGSENSILATDPTGLNLPMLPPVSTSIWNDTSAQTEAATETEAAETTSATEDGVDDGKISTGEKAKALLKGAGSIVSTMIEHPVATVAVAGACIALTAVTAGAAAPAIVGVLGGIGATVGGVKVAKGAYKAATAETDGEAKEAWESIGSGATDIGLSVAGAGTALKMAGTTAEAAEVASTASKAGEVAGAAAKVTEAANESTKVGLVSKTVGKVVQPFKNLKECIKETPNSLEKSYTTIKNGEGKQNLAKSYQAVSGSAKTKIENTRAKYSKNDGSTVKVDAKDPDPAIQGSSTTATTKKQCYVPNDENTVLNNNGATSMKVESSNVYSGKSTDPVTPKSSTTAATEKKYYVPNDENTVLNNNGATSMKVQKSNVYSDPHSSITSREIKLTQSDDDF